MQFTSLSKNTPSPANDNPVVATAGMSNERAYQLLQALLQQLNQIILGKAEAVSDAVVCLLAESQDPRYRNVFVMLSPITHALSHALEVDAE